jgi:hypothetical protein
MTNLADLLYSNVPYASMLLYTTASSYIVYEDAVI